MSRPLKAWQHRLPWEEPGFGESFARAHPLPEGAAEAAAGLIAEVLGPPRGEVTVLDVGCGTGGVLLALARAGYLATGLDLSPDMVKLAASRARRAGIELDLREGDFLVEPLPPGAWGGVLLLDGTLAAFRPEEARCALERVHQLLTPLGALVLEVPTRRSLREMAHPSARSRREERGYLLSPETPCTVHSSSLYRDRDHLLVRREVVVPDGGEPLVLGETYRGLSPRQLTGQLQAAGLTVDLLYGDWTGELPSEGSDRLIAVAHRREEKWELRGER